MSLNDKKILVGLTGGIACYKIPVLIRLLRKEGADVRAMMTQAATRFITPLTVETVCRQPVAVEMFPQNQYVATHHIDLAEWPDLVVVAPATANCLGKVAGGISDDLLTTVICATPRPVMIAPAMNPRMWGNPVTQRNYKYLYDLGYHFVDPAEGEMACDQLGVGRMAEPEQIFGAIRCFFSGDFTKRSLAGRRILVTAGPTREALDPVRYLSNRSSGKMGVAIAQAAVLMGAETTLISGPLTAMPPSGVKHVSVVTTAELHDAVKAEFARRHCLIMAAAPADFTPAAGSSKKIKRTAAGASIKLQPTVDILKETAARKKKSQVVVGFALETDDAIPQARQKLKDKKLDLIVLNRPGESTGFEVDTNQVTILTSKGKPEEWPLMDKYAVACKLLDKVSRML
ncbi:MAG: bifunctional phosphopantothenoylcysteine decarboxylase/phosphopantothenate--cysteine ligase CoaBC [Candidatus Zixiibacteriota bacterium]